MYLVMIERELANLLARSVNWKKRLLNSKKQAYIDGEVQTRQAKRKQRGKKKVVQTATEHIWDLNGLQQ